MGKQSARIYFRGKDHKEVYYQGHYHKAMYIGSTLVWEKLKAEQPSGTPLEGFSAICYYNGFFYVVNYDSSSKILYLYQGKSLQSLKQVYTVKSWYQTSHNLYIADQYGLTLIKHGDMGAIASVHFDYLENKQIDVGSAVLNNVSIPINVTTGANSERSKISFVYGKYVWMSEALSASTIYAVLRGDKNYYYKEDGMNVYPCEDAFVYNDRIFLPLEEYTKAQGNGSSLGIDEGIYIYFLTKGLEDSEFNLEKVQIPSYIFYNRAVADLLLDNPEYTPVRDKTKFTYISLSRSKNRIENGFFIADGLFVGITFCVSYTYNDETFYTYGAEYGYRFELVINLRDFSFEAVKFKDKNNTLKYDILHRSIPVDKLVLEKYSLTVYLACIDYSAYVSYLRYSSYPDYDEIIPFSEISDKYDVLKNVSGSSSSKFKFLSSYKIGNMIYCSVKKLENYLIQIDTINNTASVIKPQLYLEEE